MSKLTAKHDLLIDQYSRQEWAHRVIECLRPSNKTFSILDVGGYKGKTADFQPKDKVVVCDLFEVDEPGYVKGDGRSLPFADNAFEFVVTFDALEHVPRAGRAKFLQELHRVAKTAVIIAAPFDNVNGDVRRAEQALNKFHKDLYGQDHRWLKEHLEYKIPNEQEMEDRFKALNQPFTKIPTNDLDIWQLVQTMYFLIDLDDDLRGRIDGVNRYYNSHLEALDLQSSSSYRKIYVSSSRSNIKKVDQMLTRHKVSNSSKKHEFMASALSVLGTKYRDLELYIKYLESEVTRLKSETEHLHRHIYKRKHPLSLLKTKAKRLSRRHEHSG